MSRLGQEVPRRNYGDVQEREGPYGNAGFAVGSACHGLCEHHRQRLDSVVLGFDSGLWNAHYERGKEHREGAVHV